VVFLAGLPLWRRALLPWSITMGLLVLPYVPLLWWQLPTFVWPPATAYPSFDPPSVVAILFAVWTTTGSAFPILVPFVNSMFLLVAGIFLFHGDATSIESELSLPRTTRVFEQGWLSRRSAVAILLGHLFIPIVAFILIAIRIPLFTDRYLIISSPAFYLLLAFGFIEVAARSRTVAGLSAVVALVASTSSLWYQSHNFIKSDFREAAAYYTKEARPGEPILFVMPYVQGAFSYYYGGAPPTRPAPFTNGNEEQVQVSESLENALRDDRSIWLLLSEAELYDARGLTRDWLERHGRLVDSAQFTRVALYRYELQ
jgi:hypothetical protein